MMSRVRRVELSAEEMANFLKMSPGNVCRLCRNGTIQAEKISNMWFCEPPKFEAYLRQSGAIGRLSDFKEFIETREVVWSRVMGDL